MHLNSDYQFLYLSGKYLIILIDSPYTQNCVIYFIVQQMSKKNRHDINPFTFVSFFQRFVNNNKPTVVECFSLDNGICDTVVVTYIKYTNTNSMKQKTT